MLEFPLIVNKSPSPISALGKRMRSDMRISEDEFYGITSIPPLPPLHEEMPNNKLFDSLTPSQETYYQRRIHNYQVKKTRELIEGNDPVAVNASPLILAGPPIPMAVQQPTNFIPQNFKGPGINLSLMNPQLTVSPIKDGWGWFLDISPLDHPQAGEQEEEEFDNDME